MNHRLTQAYHRMMERIKVAVETNPALLKAIEASRKSSVDLDELSQEEAERLATYLQRDLIAAVNFVQREKQGFKDWFAFDWLLVEEKLLELFNTVADKGYLERLEWEGKYPQQEIYHAHEITGIGSLQCVNCGEIQNFTQINEILPCEKCSGEEFKRVR